MITTIVDKVYLYKEAKYLLQSIYKYMPNEKVYLFLVNTDENVNRDVLKWNKNTIIDYRFFDVPKEQYKSYMYVMMTFVFDWLINEIKIKDDIIYMDADIVLKNNIDGLYSELSKYDLMFRYDPFNRISGPTTKEFGGIMNNGCVAMKNNSIMSKYAFELKKNIESYLETKQNPVIFVEESKVITCIDQEMEFTTYLKMKDKIRFFPLNNIYNDTQYTKEGIVWHAKGSHRNWPEYLIECHNYDNNKEKLLKEYIRLGYRNIKKIIKNILNKNNNCYIYDLENILTEIKSKSILIINSNFYLDNEKVLKTKKVSCYDTDPKIYYKNKLELKNKRIDHKYVIFDTELIKEDNIDLLLCEHKNKRVTEYLKCNKKFIK